MHTGPQFPTSPQRPSGHGGRGSALLIGGISFAVVFLTIVALTIGYLMLRPSGGAESSGPPTSESASTTATGTTGTEETTAAAPADVEPERCWVPEGERTSDNPSGKLRGGGLQFIPPALYDGRSSPYSVPYVSDVQGAQAQVEDSWYSTMFVGRVEWQPGIDYPGAEVASQTITDCLFYTLDWGETKGRTLDEEITEPVTIAGLAGYRTTAIVNFTSDPLERTDATELVVVVLETDQGPSVFATETAIGVVEHEEAADEAYASLTGIS